MKATFNNLQICDVFYELSGYWGAICICGGSVGTALGIGTATVIRASMSESDLKDWGWRIPFLLTPFVGAFGLYLRKNLRETDHFEAIAATTAGAPNAEAEVHKHKIRGLLEDHWREVIVVVIAMATWCPNFYLVFTW